MARFLLTISFSLIVGCSPLVSPTVTLETQTATPSITPTRIPTVTPTQTPVPSPSPLPSILPSDWASDMVFGKVDLSIMYPIVGAIYDADRRTIDMQYSDLKLAVVLQKGVDLQDPESAGDHQELQANIAGQLDQQEKLKGQLEEINNQLPENERNKAIVVIDGSNPAHISQIVIKSKLPSNKLSIEKRYLFENGKLRELAKEEEPLLMPPLSSQGSRFIRTDTGEPVMLRGANLVYFHFAPKAIRMNEVLGQMKALKEMGGNYLVIAWNSAFVNNTDYIKKLIEVLKIGRYKYGFRIRLTLSDRGMVDPEDPYLSKAIEVVDNHITEDWEALLSNPEVAFWAGRTVDIFNIISEPVRNAQGSPHPSLYDPILSQSCSVIRSGINNPNAICGFSGGKWGWATDAIELIGKEWPERESTVNVHPYRTDISEELRPDIRKYAITLLEQDVNISVGEFGWMDWTMNPDYVVAGLKFFEENGISYSVHSLAGGWDGNNDDLGDDGSLFIDYEGKILSPPGEYLKEFWSQYQDR